MTGSYPAPPSIAQLAVDCAKARAPKETPYPFATGYLGSIITMIEAVLAGGTADDITLKSIRAALDTARNDLSPPVEVTPNG